MNYQKIYNQIIQRAQNRTLTTYIEKHHIIPKCLGGINEKENIVELTAREHYLCHSLLCEIYSNNISLKRAHWLMANKPANKFQKRKYKISSREYNRLREEFSKINSKYLKGNKYWVGRKHTDETKKKMSEIARNRSKETLQKMSVSAKKRIRIIGWHHSEKVKQKIRENSSNSKKVIHIESGTIYRSMREASRCCGIAARNIRNHCNGIVKNQKYKYKNYDN